MEIVLLIETKNYQKVKDILLKDDVTSRASIVFKDAKSYGGKEGYYSVIFGIEEQCKKALELTKDLVKEVTGKEKENLTKKMKQEEQEANQAFGGIFG